MMLDVKLIDGGEYEKREGLGIDGGKSSQQIPVEHLCSFLYFYYSCSTTVVSINSILVYSRL